jgi:hypothetical protein
MTAPARRRVSESSLRSPLSRPPLGFRLGGPSEAFRDERHAWRHERPVATELQPREIVGGDCPCFRSNQRLIRPCRIARSDQMIFTYSESVNAANCPGPIA